MNVLFRAPLIPALLAVLVLAPTARAAPDAASARAPVFSIVPTEIAATPNLTWEIRMVIRNTQSVGVYTDSLTCLMEDQDPGETHGPRQQELPVPAAAQVVHAVSAGETGEFVYSCPARFEKGRLTFRLFGHLGDGAAYVTSASVDMGPGPVSAEHPSTLIDVGGKKVECVYFASQREGAAPGLLLVHGDGSDARQRMSMALTLAARGYSVMLVSLPGYGASEGPPDLAGPRTVAALGAALDRLEHSPGVDSAHVAAWGEDLGASAVACLAAGRGDLAAVVLQSGLYDLGAVYRGTRSAELKQTILAQAGRDSAGWRARSAITRAASIHAPTLVLHGEGDEVVPANQARAFAAALTAAGTPVETRFVEGTGHLITAGDVYRTVYAFFGSKLGR